MTRTICIIKLLSFFSCRQATELTEKEKSEIVISIRQTLDNYYNDIRESGLLAELNYLDSSTNFCWVPPGYTQSISYDSVVSILKQNAPNFKYIDNSFDTLRIIPLTKELATYSGKLHTTITDTINNQVTFSLIETGVLIKRSDGWKLLIGQQDQYSNNLRIKHN